MDLCKFVQHTAHAPFCITHVFHHVAWYQANAKFDKTANVVEPFYCAPEMEKWMTSFDPIWQNLPLILTWIRPSSDFGIVMHADLYDFDFKADLRFFIIFGSWVLLNRFSNATTHFLSKSARFSSLSPRTLKTTNCRYLVKWYCWLFLDVYDKQSVMVIFVCMFWQICYAT